MSLETITVVADGYLYDQWESIQIECNALSPEVNFTLQTTEIGPFDKAPVFDRWNFPPGTMIEVYGNGDLVVIGFVWRYMPSGDATHHTVTLHCKSTTHSFNVSDVDDDTFDYEMKMDFQIVAEWCAKHGVKMKPHSTPDMLEHFHAKQGASCFQEAVRFLQENGKWLHGTWDDYLAIEGGLSYGFQGWAVQGDNITHMSAILTDGAFGTVTVIGQMELGTALMEHIQPNAKVQGGSTELSNRRTKTIIGQTRLIPALAYRRAIWEHNRTFGQDIRASVTLPGWRAPDTNQFWRANWDTWVEAPWLQLACTLRIEKCTLIQNLSQGTITQLEVVDPRALSGKDSPGTTFCSSNGMWMDILNPILGKKARQIAKELT